MVRESSVKAPVKIAAFWQNPENVWSKFNKIQQILAKIAKN